MIETPTLHAVMVSQMLPLQSQHEAAAAAAREAALMAAEEASQESQLALVRADAAEVRLSALLGRDAV